MAQLVSHKVCLVRSSIESASLLSFKVKHGRAEVPLVGQEAKCASQSSVERDLLGTRTLLGAPGRTTRSKKLLGKVRFAKLRRTELCRKTTFRQFGRQSRHQHLRLSSKSAVIRFTIP